MNAIINLYKNLISRCWIIGIADFSTEILKEDYIMNINWIKSTNRDSWFADPFILSEDNDKFIILVEEFPYKTKKGRISRLYVDKLKCEITDIKVILELDSHLSFPSYYRENGKVYIYPENSASGYLTLYEYDEKQERVTRIKIYNNNPLTDATLCTFGDKSFLLSTKVPHENKNKLEIYTLDNDSNVYQNVDFDENIARNAGLPFMLNGSVIRPAQISNRGYGEGVVLQNVSFEDKKFSFKELKRFYSPLKRYPLAFHTFNVYNNKYIIVDAQGYRYPILGYVIESLAKMVKNLLK